jgi:hypothetical protein
MSVPPCLSTLYAFPAIEVIRYRRNMSIENGLFIQEDDIQKVTFPEKFPF